MKKYLIVILLIIISTSFIYADSTEMKKHLMDNLNNEVNLFIKNITFTIYNVTIIEVLNNTEILNNKNGKHYINIEDITGFIVVKVNKK